MIRRSAFLTLLITCAAAGTPAARAATFSVNPAADAFVSTGSGGGLSGNNYGGGGAIAVSAAGLPQGELQSVLQFNLSAALSSFNSTFGAGQWRLQSATLQLSAASPANPIFNVSAAGLLGVSWMPNDAWLEGSGTPAAPGASGITFTSLQSTFLSAADESLATFSFGGATSGTFTYPLGLTSGFTSDLLAGGNVSLRVFAADSTVSGVFNSRSFGTAANRPLLTLVAVPELNSAALCITGVFLLASSRSAKRTIS